MKIIYCEDNEVFRDFIVSKLNKGCPQYTVIAESSVRDALGKATGIDLHIKYLNHISPESVEQRLRDMHADLSDIALIITDGELIDLCAGCGDVELDGWHLAQIARNLGYEKGILYVGGTSIPEEFQPLFSAKIEKFSEDVVDHIISYVKKTLDATLSKE